MTNARRTALYENIFIPSSVDCWNNLPEHLRNNPSISCFKHILLKTKFPTREAPLHYLHGSRRLSVIHARLRNNSSDLKHDLFNNYVSTSDKFQVCNEIVNAEHFYFKCRRYHTDSVHLCTTTVVVTKMCDHSTCIIKYDSVRLQPYTILLREKRHQLMIYVPDFAATCIQTRYYH